MKIEVGDIVKLKKWEDLPEEYLFRNDDGKESIYGVEKEIYNKIAPYGVRVKRIGKESVTVLKLASVLNIVSLPKCAIDSVISKKPTIDLHIGDQILLKQYEELKNLPEFDSEGDLCLYGIGKNLYNYFASREKNFVYSIGKDSTYFVIGDALSAYIPTEAIKEVIKKGN